MTEKKKNGSGGKTRREFLKDAGLLVGGTAIGSTILLAACGGGETETVTNTVTNTATVTSTAAGETVTSTTTVGAGQTATETETVTTTQTESKFICPIDGTEFDTLSLLQTHFEATHPDEPAEAVQGLVRLTINGTPHYVKAADNWTLAYVLREKLHYMGTKRGCDDGNCGWCAVIIDGRPILSCLALAVQVDGKAIQTIEGLAKNEDELHPIQQAFIDFDGMQCGICTPGQIMTAKALLDINPNPTADEVREALAGVVCRCGSYQNIVAAVLEAAG